MSDIVNNKTINRLKRVTSLISENAKRATPEEWSLSHSHVVGRRPGKDGAVMHFDIASQPFRRDMCVYGVHPDTGKADDMRHIATCQPKTMIQFCTDVQQLLTEREDPRALAINLINAIGIDRTKAETGLCAALEAYIDETRGVTKDD